MMPLETYRPEPHLTDDDDTIEDLPAAEQVVVAAVDKAAFGIALGTLGALALSALVVMATLSSQDSAANFVGLLGSNYFPGYAPTIGGLVVGCVWGFSGGFVLGFLTALARNRLLKLLFWFEATKARLTASRTVLDDLM